MLPFVVHVILKNWHSATVNFELQMELFESNFPLGEIINSSFFLRYITDFLVFFRGSL